jgi:hypothetical protein
MSSARLAGCEPQDGPWSARNRPAFIAGLLLIAVGCFAYAIGRTIPTER